MTETAAALLAAGLCKPVISWISPDTRAVVDALWAERPHALYEAAYTGRQDAMHEPFMDALTAWLRPVVALPDWPQGVWHPTAGATEGIRSVLQQAAVAARAQGVEPVLHVFEGEYEGYGFSARAAGMRVDTHPRPSAELLATEGGRLLGHPHEGRGHLWAVSAPSALDGRVREGWPAFARALAVAAPHARILLDLCYVGTVARPYHLDARVPNVAAVVCSLSKSFGVYYHRIGAVFVPTPLPDLLGNIWFKNLLSLELGRRLLADRDPYGLPRRSAALSARALECARAATGLPWAPSDCSLLAVVPVRALRQAPRPLRPALATLQRGPVLRACLTPWLDRLSGGPVPPEVAVLASPAIPREEPSEAHA